MVYLEGRIKVIKNMWKRTCHHATFLHDLPRYHLVQSQQMLPLLLVLTVSLRIFYKESPKKLVKSIRNQNHLLWFTWSPSGSGLLSQHSSNGIRLFQPDLALFRRNLLLQRIKKENVNKREKTREMTILLTDSGMYRSGMTILSGAPKRLSMVTSLILDGPVTTSFLSNADLITSGVFTWLRACSMSRSSRDLAAS